MHDRGSRVPQFDSASSITGLKSLDTIPMMSQTKQLHSSNLSHYHFNIHQHHLNQPLQQPHLQERYHQQNQSALYEYMVLQHHPHQHGGAHQERSHPTHHSSDPQRQVSHLQHQQTYCPQYDHQYTEQSQSQSMQQQQQDQQHPPHQQYVQSKGDFASSYMQAQISTQNPGKNYSSNSTTSGVDSKRESESDNTCIRGPEEVDEDMLDDDEEEDLLMRYEQCRRNLLRQPSVASQLLNFAEAVSLDIQRFFGRAKGEEDACDVYEDKWAATKSGRELYYADLIRIAQGGDTESSTAAKSKRAVSVGSTLKSPETTTSFSGSSVSPLSPSEVDALDTRTRFSGKRDLSLGMGALSDLFDFGLPGHTSQESRNISHTAINPPMLCAGPQHPVQQIKVCGGRVAPKMRERSLPQSFWREPKCQGPLDNTFTGPDNSQNPTMPTSKLPDFSDLMESWHGSVAALPTGGHERALNGANALHDT
ncbi:hypothetical protein PoB_000133300 [Plakobranchus ocellatus]|uniref:Uncharacterized protein n=1 Tax=Plakobranchus ocellatus TaxID=259542 RepID=A0AAV3XXU6_9GAST|nr:hypothetical protein PoB_000133300 [Plakobranchus ocellatus]